MGGCICGNFGGEISCSKCKYFCLVGVCLGVCEVNNYEDCMSSDSCEKFEKGEGYVNK